MTGKSKSKSSTGSAKKTGGKAGSRQPATRNGPNAGIKELNAKVTSLTASNRQLKRKIFDLYTVFEISRNFNAVLHYETLLDTFILTSLAQVGASKAALFLPPERYPNCFALQHSKGITDLVEKDAWFKADTDLLKMLARLSRPEPTGELIEKITTPKEKALLEQFHPGLVIPLIYQARLSGIFVIGDKMSNRDFQLDDIEFLSILGSQISVAIENARLYRSELAATRQLREAQEQLVHSERLAALGEMSAKIAHEINNPLGIIQNYVLLVRRTTDGNVEASNYIDVVGHEISRIARIVQELLDFTRPSQSAFAKVDLKELADEVLGLMGPQFAKQKVEIIREFPADGLLIKGLDENIRQVLMNILINALDVLPGGGQIKVAILREDGQALLRVCDSGPGIKPEIVPHIFEPFFTTKDPGKGTGLGLSVCYGIIKRHGGEITYRNVEGGGCFQIAIPVLSEI